MQSRRFTFILGFIAVLVVGLGAYLYMLISEAGDMWPALGAPGTLTAQIAQLDREVQDLNKKKAQIPAAMENLEKTRIDYELAARVLPRESGPDQLLAAIRTKAAQANVSPTSVQPSVIPAAQGRGGGGAFETWRFSLALTGSYDQLATFVNRMEEFDSPDASKTGSEKRFFEVLDINIVSQGNGMGNLAPGAANSPVQHSCTVVMQTYRYTGD